MDHARQLRDALMRGDIGPDDLTARGVATFLGATTSVVYHHWGSLDGLLHAVSQDGFALLGQRLQGAALGGLPAMAEAFVAFGLDHPVLYGLMFERRYDWAALRERGLTGGSPGLGIWHVTVAALHGRATDARVLFAGLHGLVHLAHTGRANVGDLQITDREAAVAAARRLAALLEAP